MNGRHGGPRHGGPDGSDGPGGRRRRPGPPQRPVPAPEQPPGPAPARPPRRPMPGAGPGGYQRQQGDLLGGPGQPPAPRPMPRRPRPPVGPPPDERPTEVLHLDHDRFAEPRHPDAPDDYVDEHEGDLFDDDEDRPGDRDELDDLADLDDEDVAEERPRRRGRRVLGWVAAVGVIVLLAGAAWFGARELLGFGYADYEGAGERDVLVRVEEGDTTNAIAEKLRAADVVASAKAFVEASEDDSRVRAIQPGYYMLKTRMSGANAADRMVTPGSRVGRLEIRGGTQLDDITQPDGSVTPGVLSLISTASCADLNGTSTCVPPEELRAAAESADLTALGVPEWAAQPAAEAEGARAIEGLVVPGVYDVRPGSTAPELLTGVLTESAQRLRATGLPDRAEGTGKTPYEILVIASIIEREAVKQDFAKVSRVIHNRLAEGMRLEMDSTINYALDRPTVRTSAEDRARAGAYNTYQNTGLPPTPIAAPSKEAVTAALDPAEGEWLFFVKCEKNGLSCFAVTNEEHNQNRREAQARGAY
ncbi:UPF0755 protein [Amycolatopsis arida]|uniref:Endolytic murein transglycosylase n=1 Tax=Amycolatopsis arida TaxID=587909 RepID=A0A1I5Z5N5_9PSEU|nr:endolytic transglycosylase MltG [Amycolatopsis arida]TDX90136.1 UPF0755 protein [Amycolatopsis arida]SFQ51427.1 UPF0755 protein [Amycolatopsis arida]